MTDRAQDVTIAPGTQPGASVVFSGRRSAADQKGIWKALLLYRPAAPSYGALTALLAALWFLPIPFAHYAGEDAFLAHVAAIAPYDGISRVDVYARIATYYSSLHPGWFPIAPLPLAAWLGGSAFAKLLHYVLIVFSFVLFSIVARRLLGSPRAAILAVIAALFVWQFRLPFDPVVGTSLLVPWSACLVLGTWAAWFQFEERNGIAWLCLSCVLAVVATWTSLAAASLCVVFGGLAVVSRKRRASAALILSVLGAITASLTLRHVPTPWLVNPHYFADAFAQLVAPLPTSFRAFGHLPIGRIPSLYHNGTHYVDDRFIFVPGPTIFDWSGVIVLSAAAVLTLRTVQIPRASTHPIATFLCTCALWVVPAICLWPPASFRHALPLGEAFEGVYFQYFGIALLIAMAVLHLRRSSPRIFRLVPSLGGLLVFLVAYGNVRADNVVLAKTAHLDRPRELIARAARAGFFEKIPEYTAIAVEPSLPFAVGIHHSIVDAKYMLYEYSGRHYRIVDVNHLANGSGDNAWILRTSPRDGGIVVSLNHWVGHDGRGDLTDRSLGFVTDRSLADSVPWLRRGVKAETKDLRDGSSIVATRTCTAVPLQNAFAQDAPSVAWGSNFYHAGPVGYPGPLPVRDVLGDIITYPKMFTSDRSEIILHPTGCPPTYANFQAVAVAATPAMLRISYRGHTDHLRVSAKPVAFWLRIQEKRTQPIRITFQTNAPESVKLDPVDFRYENDKPRHVHLILEPTNVWEDVSKTDRVQSVPSPTP